jgi:hypothetical protein
MVSNKSKDESERFLRNLITHTLLFPLSNQVRERRTKESMFIISPFSFSLKKKRSGMKWHSRFD